jgi:hypothetical protein
VTLRQHTDVDKPDQSIEIELSEPVSLTFSLKYLANFCKAATLSSKVKICLSNEVPLLVEFALSGNSHLRFYLAPKACPPTRVRHPETRANLSYRSATKSRTPSGRGFWRNAWLAGGSASERTGAGVMCYGYLPPTKTPG